MQYLKYYRRKLLKIKLNEILDSNCVIIFKNIYLQFVLKKEI